MSYLNSTKNKANTSNTKGPGTFQEYRFKITILGDIAVGKTSIISRYITNEFNNSYRATVGVEFRVKDIFLENCKVNLKIWDTCGEERYKSITRQYYRDTQGVLLVFDLTNPKSIERLGSWLADVKQENDDNLVVFLVGNKTDSKDKILQLSSDGKKFAMNNNIPYSEVSAKLGTGITNLFEAIARKMVDVADTKEENADIVENKGVVQIEKAYSKREKPANKKGCC
ncbi:MAG: GTP-binding protein [archaeon]|nr:GTP-binding protein [archaeon]